MAAWLGSGGGAQAAVPYVAPILLEGKYVRLAPHKLACNLDGWRCSIELARIIEKSDDPATREKLSRMTERDAAMATTRRAKFPLRADYATKVEPVIMNKLLATAVELNPGFSELLLATGDADLRWQAPPELFQERVFGLERGSGRNLYGHALMKLRTQLREEAQREAGVSPTTIASKPRLTAACSLPLAHAPTSALSRRASSPEAQLTAHDMPTESLGAATSAAAAALPSGMVDAVGDDEQRDSDDDDDDDDDDEDDEGDGSASQHTPMTQGARDLLLRYARNIEGSPTNTKFRMIRLGNEKFAAVWREAAVRDALARGGWIVEGLHITLPAGADAYLLARLLDMASTPAAAPSAVGGEASSAVEQQPRPIVTPRWGGHVAQSASTPSASKVEKDRKHDIRKETREQAEEEVRARRRATDRAAAVGTQANPVDKRGRGDARSKRKASGDARSAPADETTENKRAKPCAYYAAGSDNRCTNEECTREHGPDVSADNIAKWRRKAANAAAEINAARLGKAPVTADAVRQGRIYSFDGGRGFGWITPDQTTARLQRPQRIFFHVSDWTGTASTKPTGAADAGRRVRFVRVEDTRDRTKWKATGVSAL
jgi:predicted NAD-dependent protein-ADP-ribosyltransferase YbiA (DUF1768 family)